MYQTHQFESLFMMLYRDIVCVWSSVIARWSSRYLWIGANDMALEGRWSWVANGADIGYSNWRRGEPSNYKGEQHCAYLQTTDGGRAATQRNSAAAAGGGDDGRWDDWHCQTARINFACEIVIRWPWSELRWDQTSCRKWTLTDQSFSKRFRLLGIGQSIFPRRFLIDQELQVHFQDVVNAYFKQTTAASDFSKLPRTDQSILRRLQLTRDGPFICLEVSKWSKTYNFLSMMFQTTTNRNIRFQLQFHKMTINWPARGCSPMTRNWPIRFPETERSRLRSFLYKSWQFYLWEF